VFMHFIGVARRKSIDRTSQSRALRFSTTYREINAATDQHQRRTSERATLPFVERATKEIVIRQQYPGKRQDCKRDNVKIPLQDQVQHETHYSKQKPGSL
jgi:hypothetical protein